MMDESLTPREIGTFCALRQKTWTQWGCSYQLVPANFQALCNLHRRHLWHWATNLNSTLPISFLLLYLPNCCIILLWSWGLRIDTILMFLPCWSLNSQITRELNSLHIKYSTTAVSANLLSFNLAALCPLFQSIEEQIEEKENDPIGAIVSYIESDFWGKSILFSKHRNGENSSLCNIFNIK